MEAGVLVTGAGSGIGLEVARALLREPALVVWALARDGERRLASERAAHGDRLRILDIDLGHPEAPTRAAQAIGGRRLLAVVHNAAVLGKTAFGAYERHGLLGLFSVNAVAPLLLTQALAANLGGEPPGHVVAIGSMGGYQDSAKFPGLAAYSASKAALACLAQCLAEELKERGVRSNCLALGAADTAMLRQAFPGYRAPVTAASMGGFIAWFALHGHMHFNGRVLPVALGTP